jgi:hypothetical protein
MSGFLNVVSICGRKAFIQVTATTFLGSYEGFLQNAVGTEVDSPYQ